MDPGVILEFKRSRPVARQRQRRGGAHHFDIGHAGQHAAFEHYMVAQEEFLTVELGREDQTRHIGHVGVQQGMQDRQCRRCDWFWSGALGPLRYREASFFEGISGKSNAPRSRSRKQGIKRQRRPAAVQICEREQLAAHFFGRQTAENLLHQKMRELVEAWHRIAGTLDVAADKAIRRAPMPVQALKLGNQIADIAHHQHAAICKQTAARGKRKSNIVEMFALAGVEPGDEISDLAPKRGLGFCRQHHDARHCRRAQRQRPLRRFFQHHEGIGAADA